MKHPYYIGIIVGFLVLLSTIMTAQIQPEIDPNDPRISEDDIKVEERFVQAKYLAVIGKTDLAIKQLDTIRKSKGPDPMVHYELGRLYHTQKNINLAEENILKALELSPSNISIVEFAAKFYTEISKSDLAAQYYAKLVSLSPQVAKYYDQWINLFVSDDKASLAILDRKESSMGMSEETVLRKAEIHERSGQVDKAISEVNRLVAKYPKRTQYLSFIASMLETNDRSPEAEAYYQKILDINPDDQDAKLKIVIAQNNGISSTSDFITTLRPLIRNAEVNIDVKVKELLPLVMRHAEQQDSLLGRDLISICDDLVLTHPNNAKAHAIYADVLMNADKTDAGIRQYEKVLTLDKKNVLTWEQLLYGYDKVGNYISMANVANQSLNYFPNNAMMYYFLAKAQVFTGNYGDADANMSEATMIGSKNINVISRVEALRGRSAYLNNKYDDAVKSLLAAIEKSKDQNLEAHRWLIETYLAQKNVSAATASLEKAKKMGLKAPELEEKLKSR
jgi:tetratricopeptide (TPR) repeat protein